MSEEGARISAENDVALILAYRILKLGDKCVMTEWETEQVRPVCELCDAPIVQEYLKRNSFQSSSSARSTLYSLVSV